MTGLDSRDAERAVTLAFANVSKLPEWMQVPALGRDMTPLGELAAAALRAAGLLPGPDTIPVNREALVKYMERGPGADTWEAWCKLGVSLEDAADSVGATRTQGAATTVRP